MDEETKNILINQANMYLDGKSFREIAQIVGQSHVTVRDNITNKIKDVAPDIYLKVQEKARENSEKTIEDSETRTRVFAAYKLLTEENKTISEIAKLLGTTENVIYRDLTTRLAQLAKSYPELVNEQMVENAKNVLQNHSLNNLVKAPTSFNVKKLFRLYPSSSKRYRFIGSCCLNFGLRLDKLSEILGLECNEIEKKIYTSFPEQQGSIERLFRHGMKNQETAKGKFLAYFEELYTAFENQDKDKYILLLEEISDKKALSFKKKHETYSRITDEDIITLLNFQIKHTLGLSGMNQIFGINPGKYAKRVEALQDTYPELVSDFNYLRDYYYQSYERDSKARR